MIAGGRERRIFAAMDGPNFRNKLSAHCGATTTIAEHADRPSRR